MSDNPQFPVNYNPEESVAETLPDEATVNKFEAPALANLVDGANLPRQDEEREALLSERPDNLDANGDPHFLRIVHGRGLVCGGCGGEWPCPAFQEIERNRQRSTGEAVPPPEELVSLDQVASALGMSTDQLSERLAADNAAVQELGAELHGDSYWKV